jgi:hypothetical protein
MGYGPADDVFSPLRYYRFPTWLGQSNTEAGARALLSLVGDERPDLLVVDTLSRAVSGDENARETYHALYNHALLGLKEREVAVLRLDHAGRTRRGGSGAAARSTATWTPPGR